MYLGSIGHWDLLGTLLYASPLAFRESGSISTVPFPVLKLWNDEAWFVAWARLVLCFPFTPLHGCHMLYNFLGGGRFYSTYCSVAKVFEFYISKHFVNSWSRLYAWMSSNVISKQIFKVSHSKKPMRPFGRFSEWTCKTVFDIKQMPTYSML